MMSVSFLFTGLGLVRGDGLNRTTGWLFIASSLAAIGALIGLSAAFGANLEYRFEVTVLTINWTALIVAGVLLGIGFRRVAGLYSS